MKKNNNEFHNKRIKALDRKIFIAKLLLPILAVFLAAGIVLIVVGALNDMSAMMRWGIVLSIVFGVCLIAYIIFSILFRNSDKELDDTVDELSDAMGQREESVAPTIESIIQDFEKILGAPLDQ